MQELTRAAHPRSRVARRLALLVAVLGMAVSGAVASAPAASADSCVPGEACVYRGNTLVYSEGGNYGGDISAGSSGGYVWNNGVRYPGLDHITLTTRTPSGTRWRICLHYGAKNFDLGGEPTAGRLVAGEVVTGWTWRGECGANEDQWVTY